MKRLSLLLALALAAPAYAAFDSSEYRQNTYGAPTHYCDLTLAVSPDAGDGTLGNPWNSSRCMSQPVAGNVVGILPVGSGTPVDLAAPNSANTPAFTPANSGTLSGSTCTANIVYVTKYAAVALDYSTITTNQNRSELRHAGTDDAADVVGTGGPVYGVHTKNCVIFDGFFVDMAQIGFRNDSGIIRAQDSTGIQFRNFVIKGKTVDCDSNCVLYRPHNALNTVLSNFKVKDFVNAPTVTGIGDDLNQLGYFSDQYGDRNVTIEHFDIENTGGGIFLKGTTPGPVFNYGTIQYGVIHNNYNCLRFNDLHNTELTTVRNVLCYDIYTDSTSPGTASGEAIAFDSISTAGRNITIDHVTVAKVQTSDINVQGGLIITDLGLASGSNGVTFTNNVFDLNNGSNGHMVLLLTTLPQSMNYNCYTKNGGTESYVYNGTQYNTLGTWQAAISSRDANSVEVASVGFTDRAGDNYRITSGSCATGSSTGGEMGAYGGTTETIGIDIAAASSTTTTGTVISGGVRFIGSVRIQ